MTERTKRSLLRVGHYLLVLFLCVCTGFLLLVMVTAIIPRSAIREKSLESARDFAAENDIEFRQIRKGFDGSRMDRYADTVSLMITYGFDEKDPVNTVLWGAFTETGDQATVRDYLEQVENDIEPNFEYLRYWHGSSIYLRPMLMFFNIRQIYVINAGIIIILWILLVSRLIRHHEIAFAICLSMALVMVSIWIVPYALEYTWMFILMFAVMHICASLVWRKKQKYLSMMFMITGAAACYFDFLTVETITIGVPLLFIIWSERKNITKKNFKEYAKRYIGYAFLWLIGLVVMWVGKWMLCSIAFGPNTWNFVGWHIGQRSVQDDWYGSSAVLIYNAFARNLYQLFPIALEFYCFIPFALLVVSAAILLIWFRKKRTEKKVYLFLVGVALIPVVRMLAMHNHVYLHHFFTYRAYAVSILAILLMVVYAVDWKKLRNFFRQYLPSK